MSKIIKYIVENGILAVKTATWACGSRLVWLKRNTIAVDVRSTETY